MHSILEVYGRYILCDDSESNKSEEIQETAMQYLRRMTSTEKALL